MHNGRDVSVSTLGRGGRAGELVGVDRRVHHGGSGEDDSDLHDDHQNRQPVTLHDLSAHLCPPRPMRNRSADRLSEAEQRSKDLDDPARLPDRSPVY